MALTEHYADYKWIKVKRFQLDSDATWKNNFITLEEHHLKETTFLIDEVRKLAAMIDERDKKIAESDKRIEELAKNQKDPWPPEEWAPH